MKEVKFVAVNSLDGSDYIFSDDSGKNYHLYNDSRGREVKNMTPDFWDKFYFCNNIKIEYVQIDGINVINKIISYK
jgi:hypothetical protein